MIFSGYSPVWFLGIDAILEIIFLLITALVAWYGFKAYRLSGRRRYLWWGVGFSCITLSYAVNAFANYYLYARIVQAVAPIVPAALDTGRTHLLGNLAHVGLMLTGYLLLALVTLKFDDTRLVTLFASLVGLLSLAIVTSRVRFLFTATLLFLLIHVIIYTWKSETTTKQSRVPRRFVLAGFILLALGQLAYFLLPFWETGYVVGHAFELLGFASILSSMIIVLRK